MNTKDYIKVTPKGAERTIVLLASNRDYYRSQGAKIEEPTEEEIRAAFPELGTEDNTSTKRIAELEAQVKELQEENAKLKVPDEDGSKQTSQEKGEDGSKPKPGNKK